MGYIGPTMALSKREIQERLVWMSNANKARKIQVRESEEIAKTDSPKKKGLFLCNNAISLLIHTCCVIRELNRNKNP